MSDSSDSEESQGAQIRISLKLAGSVTDRSLEVPSEAIAVPADIGRQGLSAVLNHLLGRSVKSSSKDDDSSDDDSDDDEKEEKLAPLSFEFMLTNNKLLRKGVEKEARQHGIGLEDAIQITYFPAANEPELVGDDEKLPDWVSCLSLVDDDNTLISGCYDGSLYAYRCNSADGGLERLFSTNASAGPIKCLQTTTLENTTYIASASLDHTLNIHTLSSSDGLESYGQCEQQNGISNAIASLDFASSSLLLASGDGNGSIQIWDLSKGEDEDDTDEPTKKRKTSSGSKSQRIISPSISIDSAHTQLVSGLSSGNHNNSKTHLISSSWDHSIKLWDIQRQDCLLTLNGSRVVSCLDTSYHSEGVVATGHPDCTIRLWDVRINNTSSSAAIDTNTFRPSHRAWVSSVKWNQSNAYQLASASHDGTVKMWDIRSSNPLHTVRAFPKEEKALCLSWGSASDDKDEERKQNIMFTGGTDCFIKQLRI